jgi:ABC-2 type transport system permease protein
VHRLRALLLKELRQMARDRRTIVLSVGVPAALLLLFGFAVSFDIREIRTAVWDRDGSSASRALVRSFVSSGYFREVGRPGSRGAAEASLDAGVASLVLILPQGFGRDLARREPATVQILIDGSDSSVSAVIQGHVRRIVQEFNGRLIAARTRSDPEAALVTGLPIDFRPRVLYNPELKSRNFMVPGLIGVLLTMLGVLQTSLAIARERDLGTLDQMRTTPLRAWEILVGKMLPYALVAFANAWIALGVGRFLMGVPVRGSLWIFAAGTVLFLIGALGVGLIISAITRSQSGAQSAAFLGSVLPVFYLSDFMFPIRNMPAWLQAVTWLVPARYYVAVLRGTLQKGVGMAELSGSFVALSIYAVAVGAIGLLAIRRAFR